MRCSKVFFVATLMSVVVAGGYAEGAGPQYKIDPTHSTVIFKVKNRDISFIYGRFNKVSGTISADKLRKPTKLEIKAEVSTKSLDTNDRKRDRHLKSQEFFHVTTYPKITFETKESKQLEEDKFELTGVLSVLGVTKELTVVFEVTGLKEVKRGTRRLGGESTFTIKRSDFGMEYMLDGIADEVTVMVNLEAESVVLPAG